MLAFANILGCGGGGTGSGTLPPLPPTATVEVTPPSGNVLLGKTLQFTATVTGTTSNAVTWSVNRINGGSSSAGTISQDGIYSAPADLPAPATARITATSVAFPASSASAQITLSSDIAVGISPASPSVELGGKQSFAATGDRDQLRRHHAIGRRERDDFGGLKHSDAASGQRLRRQREWIYAPRGRRRVSPNKSGSGIDLFLWPAPDGAYRILGWAQGAFRIRKDEATGLEMVRQDSASAPLFDPVTRKFRHGRVRNLPVSVFQLKLKRALERQ